MQPAGFTEGKRFNLANGELRLSQEQWQDQLPTSVPLPGSHCFGPAAGYQRPGMGSTGPKHCTRFSDLA